MTRTSTRRTSTPCMSSLYAEMALLRTISASLTRKAELLPIGGQESFTIHDALRQINYAHARLEDLGNSEVGK